MAQAEQYRAEMRKSWVFIEEHYISQDVLGPDASRIMLRLAAKASHHEFPYAMSVLGNLMACTNGATTEVFPGVNSPLMLAVFNSNYPQTRKSCGFAAGRTIGNVMDEVAAERAQAALIIAMNDKGKGKAEGKGGPPRPPRVRVQSAVLSTFTEPAFFQRCAGDWDQIVPSDFHDLDGRVLFGTLVNLDEGYKYMKMVGLVPNASPGKSTDPHSALVADAGSEVNKLFQTGTTSLTTKTVGSLGQGNAPTISMGLTGNAHPAIVIPMLRGHLGSDTAAVSYRHLFSTGPPIEPHQALPRRLEIPAGGKRWVWPKLLKCMISPLGLPKDVDEHGIAITCLEPRRRVPDDGDDSNDEGENDDLFEPNASGFVVTLIDGTCTRLRFQKAEADGMGGGVPLKAESPSL